MNSTFFFNLPLYILAFAIFFLIIFFNWIGYMFKKRELRKFPGEEPENMGSVGNTMLGVMSLLLGFTFAISVSRYEERRLATIEEANNIGTALLRCDMYPDSIRNAFRADFKDYIESRIAYYDVGDDENKISQQLQNAGMISDRIWKRAAHYSQRPEMMIQSQQMIPSLNSMIDIVTTRDAYRTSKMPPLILWVLLILVLTSAFVLGSEYNGKTKRKGKILGFAIVMTLTLNLITELNHTRRGLINLNTVEQKMRDLRALVN
jgi:hypothetical protein